MNKLLQALALCRRAGKLSLGFDPAREAAESGKAALLICSAGLSDNTKKEIRFLSSQTGLPLLEVPATLDELWYILGKRAGVLAVTDSSLARKVEEAAALEPER